MRGLARLLGVIAILAGAATAHAGTVNVLYAGSLVNLMEHGVGPAFDRAAGDTFQGFAGGSQGLANEIKGKLRRADVFISAAPKVNESLIGPANGDWVRWYVLFARSPVVLGYNPHSRFAADLTTRPWDQVLSEPGIRIGRTDPKLDPKGALTVALMQQAEREYHRPGLAQQVLGAPDNPAQVLPEETLLGRLQSGELDVGFFYSTETADAKIPTVQLPAAIRPEARYTVTILRGAPDPAGAERFVAFLLGAPGRAILQAHGLDLLALALTGEVSMVPPALRAQIPSAR